MTAGLRVAGITVELASTEPDLPVTVEGTARKFMIDDGSTPEVAISARWGEPVEPPRERLLFDSGKGLWRLYRNGNGYCFVFTSTALGPLPYQAATFTSDFTSGQVELRRDVFAGRVPVYPLHYPLDELLFVHLLSEGRGVEIHASGLIMPDGSGYVFAGQSGAGKSTLARLWQEHRDLTILSDERIILRKQPDGVWMYGTPWHGDGYIGNPGQAPLRRMFFIRHGEENGIAPIAHTEAVARLFSCCFPPFHNQRALDFTLGLLDQVAAGARCEELSFLPDASAIDFISALEI